MVQNLHFELLGQYHMKVLIILFSERFTWIFCDTGIKSKYRKTLTIMLLISFILQFHQGWRARDGFYQITSQTNMARMHVH